MKRTRSGIFALYVVVVGLWGCQQRVDSIPAKAHRSYHIPGDYLRVDSFSVVMKVLYGKSREAGSQEFFDLEERLESLEYVFDTVKQQIFLPDEEVLIEGEEQLAAFLLYHPQQPCIYQRTDSDALWTLNDLRLRGVSPRDLDRLATEYCRLKDNVYLAVILPRGYKHKEEIKASIDGIYVYGKSVKLEGYGPYNYVKIVYGACCDHPQQWVFNEKAVAGHIAKRFTDGNLLYVMLFEADSWDNVLRWKRSVRKMLKLGTVTLHATDSHQESVALAELLFNDDVVNKLNTINMEHYFSVGDFSLVPTLTCTIDCPATAPVSSTTSKMN